MARTTLILAKNIREANEYAKVLGLQRFTYRAVGNAGSIRGTRNAEVHILPSFLSRLDRHTILGALRYAKLDIFFVDFRDGQIHDGSDEPEAVEGPTERDLEVAYRYNTLRDLAEETDGEEAGEAESGEDAAPEAPVKRRRSRCSDCGDLHYKDEPCDTSFDSGEPVTNTDTFDF